MDEGLSLEACTRKIFEEVISGGEVSLAGGLVTEAFIDHWAERMGAPQGLEGFKLGLQMIRASFPDWQSSLDDLLVDGERVAARWTVSGTHTGQPFMGIPASGRRIEMQEAGILRFEAGKLAEIWRVADELSLMRQLGALGEATA